MEKLRCLFLSKALLIRRIVYVAALIASVVFTSMFGGNLPYMCFYILIINAIAAFAYIYYVFQSIRISQSIKEHMVDKEKAVDMKFEIANEGMLSFSSVKLNFLDDYSHVSGTDQLMHFGMDTKDNIKLDLGITCHYSGIYSAGVDTIEIMDYFGIFKIKFDMPQKMRLYVKPRVLNVNRLSFIDNDEDTVNSSNFTKADVTVDNQVRAYEKGDDIGMVHWRNSAKVQKLMVKTYASEESRQYIVVLDGNVKKFNENEQIIILDKMREAYVSIINYILNTGYYVDCYIDNQIQEKVINTYTFNVVYENCARYNYIKDNNIYDTLKEVISKFGSDATIIVVSSDKQVRDGNCLVDSIFWVNVSEYEDIEDIFN